jgi:putative endonuclease
MAGGWVYILTNRPNGTLYVDVTGDLAAHRPTSDGYG